MLESDRWLALVIASASSLLGMTNIVPQVRFRKARERLGLTPDEVAARSGIPYADVWEIEGFDTNLVCCYSPRQVQQFCKILKIQPIELFTDGITVPPLSAQNLVKCMLDHCRARGITLQEFEDNVEWRLCGCVEQPEKLLEDVTVDGLQRLCRELNVDWRGVLLSL